MTARESACSSWSVCTRTPVAADDRHVHGRVGHDGFDGVDRQLLLGVLDARDLELRAPAELDAEVDPAEDRHEHREQEQHGDDRVPLLAAADEVERALARVEVVSECGEPVGHQDSLPSLVPLPLSVPAADARRRPCVLQWSAAAAPPWRSRRPCSRTRRRACGIPRVRGTPRRAHRGRGPTMGFRSRRTSSVRATAASDG